LSGTKIAGFDRAQVLAPLVIGVSGHRDIREEDRHHLESKVKEILLKLREDYSETPLVLISPLAEGADRLAAKVAIAPHMGVRLIVPLPMPIDLYEQDFESLAVIETPLGTVAVDSSSREEFRALLNKAQVRFELGLAHGNRLETIAKQGPHRDRQYDLVGKYIAQQSQILIALWDGVESDRAGGTASVVRFQREGVPASEVCALEAPEGFPVYQILTPRLKNPYPQGEVLKLRKIYPEVFRQNDERAKKYYGKMFGRLDEFNKFVCNASRGLAKGIEKSKSYLLQNLPERELPAGMEPALNRYAVADALAIRFQGKLFWAQIALHGLTFAAFFCFLLFVHREAHDPRFLRASSILVLLVIAVRIVSGKLALDTQHEDYRAMAEGLRVKFFWKLTGIRDAVADYYLGKQRSELDWIRNGFRGWNVADGQENHGKPEAWEGEEQRNRLGFARKYWIDDQEGYFRRAAKRNVDYNRRIEFLGLLCIAGVGALGVVLLVLPAADYKHYLDGIAIALETVLAAAALLHHFNNRMAYEEHAKQYHRMAALFAHGSSLLGGFLEHEDYENARLCVKKVGIEALTENGDWVLLRRERPLEVPHP
jgi:hypothetical protein